MCSSSITVDGVHLERKRRPGASRDGACCAGTVRWPQGEANRGFPVSFFLRASGAGTRAEGRRMGKEPGVQRDFRDATTLTVNAFVDNMFPGVPCESSEHPHVENADVTRLRAWSIRLDSPRQLNQRPLRKRAHPRMNNFGDRITLRTASKPRGVNEPEPGGFTEGSQAVALTGPAPPLDPAHKFHAPRRWCQNSLQYVNALVDNSELACPRHYHGPWRRHYAVDVPSTAPGRGGCRSTRTRPIAPPMLADLEICDPSISRRTDKILILSSPCQTCITRKILGDLRESVRHLLHPDSMKAEPIGTHLSRIETGPGIEWSSASIR
jgi:hypothetical protein